MKFNQLSIQEKVGQRFMFGVNSHNIDIIIMLIKKYYIGGVILYKKNYNSYEEMLSVINRLKEANKDNKIPLFISIDQEGGRVNRMPSEFKNINNIYDMSKKGINLVYDNGLITGKILGRMGINMNFAPVLDISDNNQSKLLYKRCFYGDINNVSEASKKYIEGLNKHRVISVIKHFPGHGISKMDSHLLPPYIFDKEELFLKHIKPFLCAIEKGVDALMVGHLVIRGVTSGKPASISSNFIRKYLRDEYKYDGLVISDEINMLSRSIIYSFGYIKKAFCAGNDIILIKLKDRYKYEIEKCIKLVLSNQQYQDSLDDSVNRILRIKEKYKISDKVIDVGCNIDEINVEIEKLNNKCK